MTEEERLNIAKLLYKIFCELPPSNVTQQIESKLYQMGFLIDVACDPFGRMFLYDQTNKKEIKDTSVS